MFASNRPWLKFYGDVPHNLVYPDKTLYQMIKKASVDYPKNVAINFFDKETKFPELVKKIDECAKALYQLGIRENDKVTICMPNTPQGVITFYALNKIGALPNMIHPLSAESEITYYVNFSKSKAILTLDQFAPKIAAIESDINVDHIIIARVADELPAVKSVAFKAMNFRKIKPVKSHDKWITWNDLLKLAQRCTK